MHARFSVDEKIFFVEINKQLELSVCSIPRSYSVFFDSNSNPFEKISSHLINNNVLLIDSAIIDHHQLDDIIAPEKVMIVDVSEHFKTLNGVTKILDFLAKNSIAKNDQLIIVGGGVLQEAGAFAAAMYKRGIDYIHFPTTLLSMCDSCIGGKTSLNYHDAKNQLGLYYSPKAVYINTHFLKTLPQDEISSGLGEILKSCVIGGENCLAIYEEKITKGCVNTFEDYQILVRIALAIKKTIVEADEFELNHRRSLNYGHTVGHAIEALSDFKIPHGSAIALGMILENQFSVQQGLMKNDICEKLNSLCFDLLNEKIMSHYQKIRFEKIIELLKTDKKADGDSVMFALVEKVGCVIFFRATHPVF